MSWVEAPGVCVRVCCVWRGRAVDEERALFLPPGSQLLLLPGGVKQQPQRWIPSGGKAQP